MEQIFGNSVQEAVQTSLQRNKVLFVFLNEENEVSKEFLSKFLYQSNGQLDEEIFNILKEEYIGLKLVKGSTEYGYFESIFKRLQVPSFYFVRRNEVLGVITMSASKANFKEVLNKGITRLPSVGREAGSTSESDVSLPDVNSSVVEGSSSVDSVQPSHSPSYDEAHPKNSLNAKSVSNSRNEYKVKKAMREEEANRIRTLLKNDKKERDSWRRDLKKSPVPDTHSAQDLHNTSDDATHHSSHDSSACYLLIKLFDGSTLKHQFDSSQTLNDVRNWLDNETDNNIIHASTLPSFASSSSQTPSRYVFHRPALPRQTFTDVQEFQPLSELGLPPRSALILKPIYDDDKIYTSYPNSVGPMSVIKSVGTSLGRLGSALYSFFDYSVDDNQDDGSSSLETHPGMTVDEQVPRIRETANGETHPKDSFASSKSPGFLVIDGPSQSPSLINIHHHTRDNMEAYPHESPSPPNEVPRDIPYRSHTSTPKPFIRPKPSGRIQVMHDETEFSENTPSIRNDEENASKTSDHIVKDEDDDKP